MVRSRTSLQFCSTSFQDVADVTEDIMKLEPEMLPARARSHLNSGPSLSLSLSTEHRGNSDRLFTHIIVSHNHVPVMLTITVFIALSDYIIPKLSQIHSKFQRSY